MREAPAGAKPYVDPLEPMLKALKRALILAIAWPVLTCAQPIQRAPT